MSSETATRRIRAVLAGGALAALAALAGCGGAGSKSDSGIEGRVTVGPICPVQRQGVESCEPRPLQADLQAVPDAGGSPVDFASAPDGSYRVSLPPGRYTLNAAEAGPPTLRPVDVTVEANRFTHLDLTLDSGIR